MSLRVSKGTAVIVQPVPAAKVDWFLDWQRGVAAAVEAFHGYRTTDVYPPPGGRDGEWVVLINFDEEQSLQAWLDSPVRGQWVEKLRASIGGFDLTMAPGGFGAWFAGCVRGQAKAPPSWKMALVVLLGLYPTVMMLTLFPGPFLQPLGLAVSMLIGNALSVSILQWGVMPVLSRGSASWMAANDPKKRTLSRAGTAVILALLVLLAAYFRGVTG